MHFFISDMGELGTQRNAARSVGAKLARLGQVMAAGYTVPRGFALDVAACREALDDPDVAAAIESATAGINIDSSPAELARVRPSIQDALVRYTFPEELLESLREACSGLGEGTPLAVRSSAVEEDAREASFAGQFETTLGVIGFEAMLAALLRCWSSPYSPGALAYRSRHGVTERAMPMSVGVMELVDARVAGVAFSVHPVTRRHNRVVVEANWGLGETVVSGRVSPDHVVVGKTDLRILEYTLGGKQRVVRYDPATGGLVDRPASAEESSVHCLSEEDAMFVAATTTDLETLFGYPVDVEWALVDTPAGGGPGLVVLQVRPETVTENPVVMHTGYDPIRMILERTTRKPATGG